MQKLRFQEFAYTFHFWTIFCGRVTLRHCNFVHFEGFHKIWTDVKRWRCRLQKSWFDQFTKTKTWRDTSHNGKIGSSREMRNWQFSKKRLAFSDVHIHSNIYSSLFILKINWPIDKVPKNQKKLFLKNVLKKHFFDENSKF